MNITELKELAEKATPGPWEAISRGAYWDEEEGDVDAVSGPEIIGAEFVEPLSNQQTTRGHCWYRDAAYIAASNPAAILELIAKLEDSQGEIRALRATEAGLVERVKDLERIAAAMLPFADDAASINGYGYYRTENPHNFHPDAESCSADEIAAHKAACDAWDAGTYKDNYGDGWVSPNVHILRAPWGIGSYTDEVPEIAAICNRARALLEKKE